MRVSDILRLIGQGVDWTAGGARCPVCGGPLTAHAKRGDIRYCKCLNPGCALRELGLTVKAVGKARCRGGRKKRVRRTTRA